MTGPTETDGRRIRGAASRRAILRRAVDRASLSGLDGLSIGQLAADLGISKSNISTLFPSKLHLQIATIRAAREQFIDTVIEPSLQTPAGLARLWTVVERWIAYSEGRVFTGGCFFNAVIPDASAKDDEARDMLGQFDSEWLEFLTQTVTGAAAQLPALAEEQDGAAVVAFEISALLDTANFRSLLHRSSEGYATARRSIRGRLVRLGADPASLP